MKKQHKLIFTFIFSMCALLCSAQYTDMHSFNGTDGDFPQGSLTQSGKKLYGMTYTGGTYNVGTIFSIDTTGANFTTLLSFNGSGDAYGSLTLSGKKLYGLTYMGGAHGVGTVFSIDTNGGGYKDIYDFTGAGGEFPKGDVLVLGRKLYGMAGGGGTYGQGVIFWADTGGAGYVYLHSFNVADGEVPGGNLTLSGAKLYGMTSYGGAYGYGTIFSVDTIVYNYTVLHSFSGADGANSQAGSLTLSGKKLYGMTYYGGTNDSGVIFSIDTTGANYAVLFNFSGANGGQPWRSLTVSGNKLYGMTEDGGTHNVGNIISIDTDGTNYTQLFSFNGTDGKNPTGSLLLSGHKFYGMTPTGGAFGDGVIFSDDLCSLFVTHDSSTSDNGSGNGSATVTAGGGPLPYTYLWEPGGQTTQSISGLSAGSYTVTVSDAMGCQNTSTVTVGSTAGINNLSVNDGIMVYPNPNSGNFTVTMPGTVDKSTVEVYNVLGEQLYSHALTPGNNSLNINTASGVYMYKIISDKGNLIGQGKLIIQNLLH